MAWYLWVDDDKVGANCSDLSTLSEKSTGFQGGKAAVAKNVNVALRQANLVACALMDVIDSEAVLSYLSTREAIAAQCAAYFSKFATETAITNGTIKASKAIQLCSDKGTVKLNAGSDDEYILPHTDAGVPKFKLGSGNFKFEEVWSKSFNGDLDGTATRATYASADTTKGTIEERLTNMGFRQLPTDRQITMIVSGAILNGNVRLLREGTTREGNRTQILFSASFVGTAEVGAMFDFFGYGKQAISSAAVIPEEYRPIATSSCKFDYELQYVYANGLSFTVHADMQCTIYGADTENAGKIALQVLPPRISGTPTTLSKVIITSSISSYADTGYSSKAL